MSYAPFDVVVVPFPYSDRLAEKRRPALIVSDAALANELGRVWVAMITSDRGVLQLGDMMLEDLAAAGLPAPSIVRASKIAAIETDRIARRAGGLSATDRAKAAVALKACAAF